ncbi:hypothetical protein [Coleofasciculus sp. FACHB-1120]|uniref:hypothetical protein n=1 Tax=Coleofasciculus sp. FACHB-1120 TaxID=2692783 RepID=UPI00168A0CBC|nr:hypothetical protein [Coleofasciculus sp. FACHB-1120]MBD2740897.1 hypothetical protein [Coleofasciculus sp. FACHB-1120]
MRLTNRNFIDKNSKICSFGSLPLPTGGLNQLTTKLQCLLEKMAQIARQGHDVGDRVFYDETKVRAIAQLAGLGRMSFGVIPLIFKEHNQPFSHHQSGMHPFSISARHLQNAVVLVRALALTEDKTTSVRLRFLALGAKRPQ